MGYGDPSSIGGACGHDQLHEIKGFFRQSRCAATFYGNRSRGGELSAGHAIGQVVETEGRDIQISPGCMDEMITADGCGIAVTHDDNNGQVRRGGLDTRSKGKSAAVEGMHRITIDVKRSAGGTTDAGNDNRLLRIIF